MLKYLLWICNVPLLSSFFFHTYSFAVSIDFIIMAICRKYHFDFFWIWKTREEMKLHNLWVLFWTVFYIFQNSLYKVNLYILINKLQLVKVCCYITFHNFGSVKKIQDYYLFVIKFSFVSVCNLNRYKVNQKRKDKSPK